MKLARIVGSVVATARHPIYDRERLLLAEPVSPDGKSQGNSFLLVDTVQAGPGDTVLFVDEGNSARMVLKDNTAPVRAVSVAIVDAIEWSRA